MNLVCLLNDLNDSKYLMEEVNNGIECNVEIYSASCF